MQSLLKDDSKFLKTFRMLRERMAEVKSVMAKCKYLKQLRCTNFISQFNCGDGADSN